MILYNVDEVIQMEIINQSNYDEKTSEGLVLVDFFATWCGPCKMLAPILDQLSSQYEGKVAIYKVDVDKDPALASRYGIQAIPTMVLFKDGQALKQTQGFMAKPQIEALLNEYL